MFVVLKHVYIPLLFFSGVDYIDAPTPYMMGLHSGVDTSALTMDGVSLFIQNSWFNLLFRPLCTSYIVHFLNTYIKKLSGFYLVCHVFGSSTYFNLCIVFVSISVPFWAHL